MYSYVDLTATVLNCRLPTTRHINYIVVEYLYSASRSASNALNAYRPKLARFSDNVIMFAVMVCFTHISCNNRNRETTETMVFCEKPNRKWNIITVTALMHITAHLRWNANCLVTHILSKIKQETQLMLTKPRDVFKRSIEVTKHSIIPYVMYSFLLCNSNFVFKTSKNVVTLKSGSEVTQGHWKWNIR